MSDSVVHDCVPQSIFFPNLGAVIKVSEPYIMKMLTEPKDLKVVGTRFLSFTFSDRKNVLFHVDSAVLQM